MALFGQFWSFEGSLPYRDPITETETGFMEPKDYAEVKIPIILWEYD